MDITYKPFINLLKQTISEEQLQDAGFTVSEDSIIHSSLDEIY